MHSGARGGGFSDAGDVGGGGLGVGKVFWGCGVAAGCGGVGGEAGGFGGGGAHGDLFRVV